MQGWCGKRVHFAHVPRERNSWAHHLAAQALAWSREVELQELTSSPPLGESAPREILPLPQVEPAPVGGLGALCAAAWAEGESDTTELCQRCKLPVREHDPHTCGLCRATWHLTCLPSSSHARLHPGPWHCQDCIRKLQAKGVRDITLDQPLLRYLATGNAPAHEDEAARVVKAGRWLWLDSRGVLWATHESLGWQQRIPTLGERGPLLREALRNTGFPEG